eukprot:gb/GECG01005450.1/.p1 GENE.gb/GECG01005450.1/~~gb/GECG01005450.1/.p1  ORF type:complete len:129 (+),score=15.08 gb/GECG01005450.1/:1-387(+)
MAHRQEEAWKIPISSEGECTALTSSTLAISAAHGGTPDGQKAEEDNSDFVYQYSCGIIAVATHDGRQGKNQVTLILRRPSCPGEDDDFPSSYEVWNISCAAFSTVFSGLLLLVYIGYAESGLPRSFRF